MRRLLALALPAAAVALVLLPAAPARASCAQRDARTIVEASDAAFVGTFVEQRGAHYVFAVERAVKGDLGPEVLVLAPAEGTLTSVDLRPRPGERLGLGLARAPAGWTATDCSRADPDALLATGGRACDPPAIVSVRRLSAARAGRTVRLGIRIAGARDAVHVVQVGWGDGTTAGSVTLRAGDDGAVLRHRFGPARRRVVTARVETVPFGGCGEKVLRSAPARLAFRVSRG